jgi:hypothetical protein
MVMMRNKKESSQLLSHCADIYLVMTVFSFCAIEEINDMAKNAEGNFRLVTTMGRYRAFSGWQDELDMPDDTPVVVYEDGWVSCARSGDRIKSAGFQSVEVENEWRAYWGF